MLSTGDIDNFVAYYPNIKKNYCGTLAVDQLDTFEECDKLVQKINRPRVFNTDPIQLPGQHWMTLIKLQDKRSFMLFDSFGAVGFQEFLIGNRIDIVERFFPNAFTYANAKNPARHNFKIDVKPLIFLPNAFLDLSTRQLNTLTPTMQGLGLFLTTFAADRKMQRLRLYVVVDRLQDPDTDICGIFALHFLHSIYYLPNKQCNRVSCTIKTVRTILDQSFHEGSESGSQLNTLVIKEFQAKYM